MNKSYLIMSNCSENLLRYDSELNPTPYTIPALKSAHCPNLADVLVNIIFGATVLLMIVYTNINTIIIY